MASNINGFSVAYTVAGAIILWSGIVGESISNTILDILHGKKPSSNTQAIVNPAQTLPGDSTATSTSGPTTSLYGSTPKNATYNGSDPVQANWVSYGGSKNTAAIASAIAQAESGGNPLATSSNPDGGTNVGVFQLDTKGVGSGYSVAQLQNPQLNYQITIMATSNGTNWSEWGNPVADALPNHHYTPGAAIP